MVKMMSFGKYQGEQIRDVPLDYLLWALHTCNMSDLLVKAIKEEICQRVQRLENRLKRAMERTEAKRKARRAAKA
jgi:hypothetical protein